jgi:DNA-binding LytR/AlgR family response regulator
MKILAVEDDILFANTLELLVESLGYTFQAVDNARDAYAILPTYAPDLLLLDIHLKGQASGLDIAEKMVVMKKQLPIIFVTSFKDKEVFARAKKISPFAYIIKPVDALGLENAIELALQNAQNQAYQEQSSGWQTDIILQDSFFIKTGDRLEKVTIQQIAYIGVEDKFLHIHTSNKRYIARMSMQEILARLPQENFLRVHRGYIINIQYIESVLTKESCFEILGTKIPYSEGYAPQLLQRLNLLG